MVDRSIVDALTSCGRSTPQAEKRLRELKAYLSSELPVDVSRDVLNVALNRDRLRCHHNPTGDFCSIVRKIHVLNHVSNRLD